MAAKAAGSKLKVTMGGVAVVCCVHDREKRIVTDTTHIQEIGRFIGIEYDPVQDKIHKCACCENLFVDPTDEPRFCEMCRPPSLVHALGGELPTPIGVVG